MYPGASEYGAIAGQSYSAVLSQRAFVGRKGTSTGANKVETKGNSIMTSSANLAFEQTVRFLPTIGTE